MKAKSFRRLTALLVAVMLVVSMCVTCISASAAAVSDAPYLTVNATSNFFSSASAEYNEDTNQVTVSYYMNSRKNIENFQFTLYFDSDVFSISSANNTIA